MKQPIVNNYETTNFNNYETTNFNNYETTNCQCRDKACLVSTVHVSICPLGLLRRNHQYAMRSKQESNGV